MRSSRLAVVVVATLVLLTPGPRLEARDRVTVDGLLAAAKAHAEQGRSLEAARTFGQAAALAHRHGDPEEEARVRRPLDRFLLDVREPVALRNAIAAVIEELDVKRAGAFVSAHALAREILLLATREGERTGVVVASKALTAFSAGRRRGKAADVLADFGTALVLLDGDDGDPEVSAKAATALATALAACVEERWSETAVAIGTELAVLRLSAGDDTGARDALASVAEAIEDAGGYADRQVLITWVNTVRTRLADASDAVLAPYHEMEKRLHGASAEPGGSGAPGARPDEEACLLARAWSRLSSRKRLVSVERTSTSHVARLAYVRRHEAERSFRTGQRRFPADGILLLFHGHAVALGGISLRTVYRGSGGGPHREGFYAWYLLADGEAWSLHRDGRVSIGDR